VLATKPRREIPIPFFRSSVASNNLYFCRNDRSRSFSRISHFIDSLSSRAIALFSRKYRLECPTRKGSSERAMLQSDALSRTDRLLLRWRKLIYSSWRAAQRSSAFISCRTVPREHPRDRETRLRSVPEAALRFYRPGRVVRKRKPEKHVFLVGPRENLRPSSALTCNYILLCIFPAQRSAMLDRTKC